MRDCSSNKRVINKQKPVSKLPYCSRTLRCSRVSRFRNGNFNYVCSGLSSFEGDNSGDIPHV